MARRSAAPAPALRFRGLPQRLSASGAALAGHASGEIVLPDALAPYSPSPTVALPVRERRPEGASLRLRLDRTAPAGRYQAELRLGGTPVPVELEIAPAPLLRAFPARVDFAGAPGAEAEAEIGFTNIGNVAIDLAERFEVELFDGEALDDAFAELYRQGGAGPLHLISAVLERIGDGYGGWMAVRIAEGAGPLAPGAERAVRLVARLPEGLRPGRSYGGVWKVDPFRYQINVAVQQ